MKKLIYLVLVLSFFFYCGPKQNKVEKIMEDGIEIIVNHLEPYKIKGEQSTFLFVFEEEFTIDFEREDIAKLGISDIRGFDVDSEGNIYLSNLIRGSGDCIYKFDRNGNFITSFGKKGQGPGELQIGKNLYINDQDFIQIIAPRRHKLIVYRKDGSLVKEVSFRSNISGIIPVKGGNFLVSKPLGTPESLFYYRTKLYLCNTDFKEIKELERVIIPNMASASYWMATKRNIYVGNDERGYEIWVYDLGGNLLRKIRKEFKSVEIPDKMRKGIKNSYDRLLRQSLRPPGQIVDAPTHWPPFSAFFTDEKERLYVRTWEKGENPGEYIHDIFNHEGIFIGRMSLNILFSRERNYAKAKNDRLYFLREKESGYKELVVYKIIWE